MVKKLKIYLNKMGLMMIAILGIISGSFAQEQASAVSEESPGLLIKFLEMDPLYLTVFVLIIMVMVLLLITLALMVNAITFMQKEMQKRAEGEAYVETPSLWSKIYEKLVTGKLYAEKEERTSMMLDHDYDGIKEMDYGMPPWLSAVFVGTILFAIVYLVQLWGLGTLDDQITEYNNQMEKAEIEIAAWREKQANLIDESSVSFVTDQEALQAGKEIFIKECKACHAEDGGGGVGPNLTDNYWINGADIADIFSTIKYGVPEKGMISWQTKLKAGDMQNVASYILTLVGTSPANPKEPQGELYSGEVQSESNSEQNLGDSLNLEDKPVEIEAGI